MIDVTDRKTYTLHHTNLKMRIKHYTQTHIILLVISINLPYSPEDMKFVFADSEKPTHEIFQGV